jgi:predicted acylesterase/phospholipase RssA
MLLGLAAMTLASCSSPEKPRAIKRSVLSPDPLRRFRLFSDSSEDVWQRHMGAAPTSRGPNLLALSGGGEDGAFGAGALIGWSEAGDRPAFDVVTGVSTGALIAPFAFLGSTYDDHLRRIFTQYDADDIMQIRPFQALYSDALYDTAPLAKLIRTYTPPSMIDAVAARHAKGARLFVVTSELDQARASVWDMGEIAKARQYDLFRAIMRASAALPGLFPPVTLNYTIGDTTYSETHIDGGVHMQFLAIPDFAYSTTQRKLPGAALYLMINNTLDPAPVDVSRSALSISQQALTTSIRASAQSTVNATKLFARSNGIKLSVASVDPAAGIVYDASDRFSSTYMNALYKHGFERAIHGTLWSVQ